MYFLLLKVGHYPIFCTIKNPLISPPISKKLYTYRKISSIDAEQFCIDLESTPLSQYEHLDKYP